MKVYDENNWKLPSLPPIRSYEIHFEFPLNDDDSIETLNDMLAGMRLTELDLRGFEGYVGRSQHFEPDGTGRSRCTRIEYWYGLKKGTLICEQVFGKKQHIYRIDTEVVEGTVPDHEAFTKRWKQEHPGRVMRTRLCLAAGERLVYIVLHHEKGGEIEWPLF